MVSAQQFVASYLIVDVLCLILSIIIARAVSRDLGTQTQNRYFLLVLGTFMVFDVFDAVWGVLGFSGLFSPSALTLSIVNGINLSAIAFAACFWTYFTRAYFGLPVSGNKLQRLAHAIPAAMVPMLHALGYALNQNVIVNPDGTMTYGWMHAIIVCIQMLYVLMATYISAREYHRAQFKAQRRMCLVFMTFMLPFVVGGSIDALIPNTPIAAASMAASFTFVMLSMQESRISTDALTGLNNRRRADAYLEQAMTHASPGHPVRLYVIDLDGFKNINDTYGHLEGDNALRVMADSLRLVCARTNGFAARWGGDEFVLIYTKLLEGAYTIPTILKDTLAEKANEAGLAYRLACSVGLASCNDPSDSIDELIAKADEMMYRAKRANAR